MSKGTAMTRNRGTLLGVFALCSFAAGCGGYARTPEQWTDDTYKLLEQQNEAVKDCYEKSLKSNAKLEGNVVVSFIVDNKTGRVRKAKIDINRTTAGDPARKCVLDSLRDLKLTPGDAAEGHAVFTWEFNRTIINEDGTTTVSEPPKS